MLLICDAGQLVVAAGLLLNAHLDEPNLATVYVLAALIAVFSSLGQPSLWAITPRLVGERYYPAASALESSSYSLAAIIGPTIGGLLIAAGDGAQPAYLFAAVTYVASLASLVMLGPVPPSPGAPQAGLRSIADGFRYLKGKPVLQGTYIVDFIAMVFGMPRALFPFFADEFGGDQYLGFLYAAPALGALLASVLSGWTGHIRRHGLGVIGSVVVWGLAIFAFGISPRDLVGRPVPRARRRRRPGERDLPADDLGHPHLGRVPRAAGRHRVGQRPHRPGARRRRSRVSWPASRACASRPPAGVWPAWSAPSSPPCSCPRSPATAGIRTVGPRSRPARPRAV